MALVPRGQNNAALAQAATAIARSVASGADVAKIVKELGKLATRQRRAARSNVKDRSERTNKEQRPAKQGRNDLAVSLPRGLGNAQSHRTILKDVVGLGNTSAGAGGFGWALGVSGNGTLAGLFNSAYMPRFAALAALYRQYKLSWVRIEFSPTIPDSSSGSIAFGYDPDPMATIPTDLSTVLRHNKSCLSDLQSKCVVTYRPIDDGKKDPRFVAYSAGKTYDETTYGLLEIFSANSLATGATIGYMVVTVDVTFIGPQ